MQLNFTMKSLRKNLLKILFVVLMLAAPTSSALANSLPPPFEMWLTFVSEKNKPIQIVALQLIGCSDSGCAAPQVLKTYGECNSPKCLTGRPVLSDKWKLNCAGNRCLFETRIKGDDSLPPYLKLVFISTTGTWVSESAAFPDCNYCESGLKVLPGEERVVILADADFAETGNINKDSFTAYLISVLIEMAIAGLILWVWKKKWALTIKKGVWAVLFANLLSFPITWILIPSFGRFEMRATRQAGYISAIAAVIILLIALWISENRSRIKKWMIILAVVLIPVFLLLVGVGLIFWAYGDKTRTISGLPPAAVIALAETFAVSFETLIIYLFCKESVSIKQAFLLSLATNAVSFGVSLFLYN
jgi:hypothetical protein